MNQREIINKLIKYDMIQSLSNLSIYNEVSITEEEIEYLCKISSILSLSDDNEEQTLAYEIITKVFKNFYEIYPNIYSISYTILSRLGNFPNRELLEKFGFNQSDLHQNPILKIETLSREVENSIELMGRKSLLTNFQKNFFDVLTKKKFYSISAPTSAGKSFIFTLSIIQRLLENSNEKIVLIVPTRALIKELSDKVFHSLKQFDLINDVYVRTVPIVEDDIDDKGGIYVLTQERLNTLLNETDILLDTVFIDEAQEIQSNRGVVLQNTLESVLSKFPDINLFFASPLVNNPEYFNSLLSLDYHEHHFKEEVSPVGQNIIFLSSVKGKTQIAKLDLYTNGEYLSLGELNFDTRFRDRDRMITLAKTITNDDELSLVYCNNPSDTETLATKMANNITEELDDEDISSLISFIEEDIHEEYSLIPCLKKGIAYHYGKVPSTIRAEIEKLAGEKKLKYIFTTSTLLQGVNLPTKNIIIYNPSKGLGKPMERRDFLNLIGRAGRLQYEFQGNIWCIDPSEWQNKSFEGERLQNIESFYTKTLNEKIDEIEKIALDNTINSNDYLPVFGKFYNDFIIDKNDIDMDPNINDKEKVKEIIETCNSYNLGLPNWLIKKHYSIHPKNLNELYNFFISENDLTKWIPKNVFIKKKTYPYEDGTYERLLKIFKKIDNVLLNKHNEQYKLYTKYASSWIHDNTLKEIILDNHSFNLTRNTNRTINSSIRESLDIIESYVRFEYVLYTGAYLDILKHVVEEKNLDDEAFEKIPNLPLYLECGSADSIVINLISLGLSRLTSIKLKNSKYFSCDEPTATTCFKALQNLDIKNLDIPEICKKEIFNMLN